VEEFRGLLKQKWSSGMNMKASALIMVSVSWIAGALLFLFSGVGFGVPGWIPLWLVIPAVIAAEVLLFLGWLVPLTAGIRLLMKRR
jgi:hypothetical protein